MIGEIRDRATMQHAIAYSETGHLCLSTLHANNANQAMERVINFFPDEARHQLLTDLSLNIAGVIAQRLVLGLEKNLVPAVEVLLSSAYVSDLIAKGDIDSIKDAMKRSNEVGMCTFDQALFKLYEDGKISLEQALVNADSRTDLLLRVRLAKGVNEAAGLSGLKLEDEAPHDIPARFRR
jgi:twitching motility protein PilU